MDAVRLFGIGTTSRQPDHTPVLERRRPNDLNTQKVCRLSIPGWDTLTTMTRCSHRSRYISTHCVEPEAPTGTDLEASYASGMMCVWPTKTYPRYALCPEALWHSERKSIWRGGDIASHATTAPTAQLHTPA